MPTATPSWRPRRRCCPTCSGRTLRRRTLRFARPDGEPAPAADILLVSNGVYRLDSLNGFGTRERMDTGVLGIVTVTVDRARDLPALMSAEATGRLHRFRGYREWTAPEFEVDSTAPLVEVGVDGEALSLPAVPLAARRAARAGAAHRARRGAGSGGAVRARSGRHRAGTGARRTTGPLTRACEVPRRRASRRGRRWRARCPRRSGDAGSPPPTAGREERPTRARRASRHVPSPTSCLEPTPSAVRGGPHHRCDRRRRTQRSGSPPRAGLRPAARAATTARATGRRAVTTGTGTPPRRAARRPS